MFGMQADVHQPAASCIFFAPGTCTTSAKWTVVITHAAERMDPAILRKTESLGSDDKRLEHGWQMELYRVILDLLPFGQVVSPDVVHARSSEIHGILTMRGVPSCTIVTQTLETEAPENVPPRNMLPQQRKPNLQT